MKTNHHKDIPKFSSCEEEALFWDTHGPEDFPEEFTAVDVDSRRPLGFRLAVPLEPSSVAQLEKISKARGVEPVALAQQWILEHIPTTR